MSCMDTAGNPTTTNLKSKVRSPPPDTQRDKRENGGATTALATSATATTTTSAHIHRSVVVGIARHDDMLYINGYSQPPIDRRSSQHLVDHLFDNHSRDEVRAAISDLLLGCVELVRDPSDGGVNVLRELFSRSDTTLTRVVLQ